MLLRFNEGAIVRLKLVGFQEPFSVEGRVVVVTSDEVVIAPQVKIISDGSSIPFQTIDDGSRRCHYRRLHIICWEYIPFEELLSETKNLPPDCLPENISMFDPHTSICTGLGKNFGNIREEF